MRRNTVRLLKYLVIGGVVLVLGPIILRHLWGRRGMAVETFINANAPLDKQAEVVKMGVEEAEDSADKMDWHDYKAIEREKLRQGPGEQGQAYIMSQAEEQQKGQLYKTNGFNALASDKISLHRALKDIRHHDCQKKKYVRKLPTASVILPFHNEHFTTLLRSVHSILDRASSYLVHEVILADDFSNKEHCKKPLDDYVKEHFTNVMVVRAAKREGLIRTRLMGAKAATGDVLIFLDSHIEANINYLPPLLEPIAQDYRTVVCPFIDVIDYENFAYRAQDEGARGAFDWEFFYKRLPLLDKDKKHPAEPFESPVMAGGLFAISREWFWELGGYDPGLDIWGGEQYELSFKLWQCGGRMVDAPCSRIGHIYRKFAPFPNPGMGDFVGRNYRRVAEVWMDEYAEYLYKKRPHYRNIDPGDLSEQRAIRKKLKCKPFKWFIENVAFDLSKYYPPVEPQPLADGELRNPASNLCVDTRYKGANERFQLENCVKDGGAGGEQQLELSWHKDVRPRKRTVCFDASESMPKAPVILFSCHGMQGNQRFKYNLDTHQLYHPVSNQCLDCDADSHEIFMFPCKAERPTQAWIFEHINATAVRADWPLPLD
ncbi:hypothetical protein ACOMHN_035003 [Nucella lapillus]